MPDLFISEEKARSGLLDAAAFLGERINSSDGHAEAMLAVVPLMLGRGDVDLAAELSNAVDDPYTRDRLLGRVASACAEKDDDEYALQLADAVEDEGLRQQTFEAIGVIKASKGQFEAAREAAALTPHPDFIFAAIADSAEAGSDADAMSAAIDAIEFPAAIVAAYHRIAVRSITAGDLEKAVPMLEKAAAAADEIEHAEERIGAVCDIAAASIDARRNDLAIRLYDSAMKEALELGNVHTDSLLAACALGFCRAGSEELSEKALDEIRDKVQMSYALLGIAREEWRREQKDTAKETLEDAFAVVESQPDHEIRDSRSRNDLMATIAIQFAGFGDTARAVSAARANLDDDQREAALGQIARILLIQNERDEIGAVVGEIGTPLARVFAYAAMADLEIENGRIDEAKAFLATAANESASIPQPQARTIAFAEIAERSSAIGDAASADTAAAQQIAAVAEIKDASARATALARLSNIYRDAQPPASVTVQVNDLIDKAVF